MTQQTGAESVPAAPPAGHNDHHAPPAKHSAAQPAAKPHKAAKAKS
jgi:hypothetical protein